jgi:hypothetical protein
VDEGRHVQGDAWWFDLAVDGGPLRCLAQLVAPAEGPWRWWSCLVRDDLVVVIDDDVPPAPRLEIRTEGLWAEVVVEEAFEHVSLGCEAFALGLDPPLDLSTPLLGHRIPFGLDLGFELTGEVAPDRDGDGYSLPCRADGVILVGADEVRIEGATALRGHSWGPVDATWLTTLPLPPALRN